MISVNTEKDKALKIYTILLSFNDIQGRNNLNDISLIGGTEKAYSENTFKGLDNAFQDIANLINPKFGLKFNNKANI